MKKVLVFAFFFINTSSGQALAKERVKLEGYAEWRYDDVLVIEGQRVQATARTLFVGNTLARDLESIPLGSEVKVDGYRNADGSVLARKVVAKRNGSAMFEGQLASAFEATENQWRRRATSTKKTVSGSASCWRMGPTSSVCDTSWIDWCRHHAERASFAPT